jgi:hypothetical protein
MDIVIFWHVFFFLEMKAWSTQAREQDVDTLTLKTAPGLAQITWI